MKDIFASVGKIMGLIFAAGVIAFTGWMTMKLGQRLIPQDTLMQWMILILFDGAAVIWFFQFLTQAKGTLQWAISGIGWLLGLIGAVIMTAGELILGQKLITIDDPTRFGWLIISTVVIAALGHALLVYLFHFADPATRNRIENAQKVSKAIETAYANARQEIDRHTDQLTAGLIDSAIHEAEQQIRAVTAFHIRNAAQLEARAGEIIRSPGPVIDSQSTDKGATPKGGWFGWKKRARPPAAVPEPPILTPELMSAIIAYMHATQGRPAKANGEDQSAAAPEKTYPADTSAAVDPTQPPA